MLIGEKDYPHNSNINASGLDLKICSKDIPKGSLMRNSKEFKIRRNDILTGIKDKRHLELTTPDFWKIRTFGNASLYLAFDFLIRKGHH